MDRDFTIGLADLLAQVSTPMMLSPGTSVCIEAAGKLAEIIEDLRAVGRATAELERAWDDKTVSDVEYARAIIAAREATAVALDRLQVEHKRKNR